MTFDQWWDDLPRRDKPFGTAYQILAQKAFEAGAISKTCQHCKHWDPRWENDDAPRCSNPLIRIDDCSCGARIISPADFGCNQWEVKE